MGSERDLDMNASTAPAADATVTPAGEPFQPHLDARRRPMGNPGPQWSELGGDELIKFAQAIILPEDVIVTEKVERLSLPSPWARLLLFEHAILYGEYHPAREQILSEWRGLLGLIALSQLLSAGSDKNLLATGTVSVAGTAIADMRPGGWPQQAGDEVTLIYWGGKLVGGSSPMTFVFTGRRRLDRALAGIPFVTEGRLSDPLAYYRQRLSGISEEMSRTALKVLTAWLGRTREILRADRGLDAALGVLTGEGGQISRRRKLEREIDRWYQECVEVLGDDEADAESIAGLELMEEVELFRQPLSFIRPIRWQEQQQRTHPLALANESSLVVDPANGIILDRNGNRFTGSLPVRGAVTVDVREGIALTPVARTLSSSERRLGLADLFESRLIRLNAPDEEIDLRQAQLLVVGMSRYFLPINPEVTVAGLPETVLAGITAEELRDRSSIVVRVDLPVQGGNVVRFEKQYPKTSAVEEVVPSDLWIWPDFELDSWHSYYWANAVPSSSALNYAKFTPVEKAEDGEGRTEFRPNGGGGTRWGLGQRPLRQWTVSSAQSEVRGLLVVRMPGEPGGLNENLINRRWEVAIDFGSTHTVGYVRPRNSQLRPEELPLRDRTVRLIGTGKDVEYNFFAFRKEPGAPSGAPTLVWAPADHLFDPRNSRDRQWLPGFGQIFYGTEVKGRRWSSLFANLKWRPMSAGDEREQAQLAFKNYFTHLCVMIGAEAAAHDAEIEKVLGSYPGIFSYTQKKDFEATLRAAVNASNTARTGEDNGAGEELFEEESQPRRVRRIEVELPCDEATALESYLVTERGLVSDTGLFAVDIGGSTSDFVVRRAYEANRTYASIQFAGGIVNRIIGADDTTANAVRAALRSNHIGLNDRDVGRIMRLLENAENRAVGAGLLLRLLGADPTAMPRFATALFSAGTDGQRIIAALAYLFATNAFFMGLLAHPMEEGREEEGYNLHLAGRGALLVEWLNSLRQAKPGMESSGAGQELIAHFFLAGVNAEAIARGQEAVTCRVAVELPRPEAAKREVAMGLLNLHRSPELHRLAMEDRTHANPLSELGFVTAAGIEVPWNQPLTPEILSDIKAPRLGFKAKNLAVFTVFVNSFSTLNLRIQGLDFARLLQISPKTLEEPRLTERTRAKLFGEGSAWKRVQDDPNSNESSTFEPFFISSAKALLEHGLGVVRLF